MSSEYPRVLHVGFQPIGSPTNSGLTLQSMFAGWPERKLMQVCLRDDLDAPKRENTIIASPMIAPVDGVVRRVLGKHVPSGAIDGLNNSIRRDGLRQPTSIRARVVATALNDIGPVRVSRPLLASIRRYDPQVIHSLLGGVRAMRIARIISTRLKIPLVPHFMDDWLDNLYTSGQLFGVARRIAEREISAMLAISPLCLVIGDEMATEFTRRLERPCIVVGNSVNFAAYDAAAQQSNHDVHGRRALRYIGGLHLGRDAILGAIGSALDRVRCECGGCEWQLELFVPDTDRDKAIELAAHCARVKYMGSMNAETVPAGLTSADALVFVESSKLQISTFTHFSVSTKVPQYIAAGRPVLVVGPDEQASVRALCQLEQCYYAGSGADLRRLDAQLRETFRKAESVNRRHTQLEPRILATFDQSATHARLKAALAEAARQDWGGILPP